MPAHPPTGADARRVAVASAIGTTIEWYDFFIYGTAAAMRATTATMALVGAPGDSAASNGAASNGAVSGGTAAPQRHVATARGTRRPQEGHTRLKSAMSHNKGLNHR